MESKPASTRPKLGLALGSGGARGMAHFGVLQRLAEWGVRVDCVAGTSIGAIAGAVFAAGGLGAALKWVRGLDWKAAARLFAEVNLPRTGILSGRRIDALLAEYVGDGDIRALPVPFAAVATDIATGERVVIDRGPVVAGVHASFSIPGVFMTVKRDGRQLVDGGLVDPLPVDVCRSLGADRVIAVDVNLGGGSPRRRRGRELSLFDVLANTVSVVERETVRLSLARCEPDLLLSPAVGAIATLEFRRAREALSAGRAAADAVRDRILALAAGG